VVVAVLVASRCDLSPYGVALKPALVGLGLIVLLLGALADLPFARRFSPKLCLALMGLMAGTAGIEWAGHQFALDFSGAKQAFLRLPPFYRQPTVPTGTVFYRRPGPEVWRGQVLRTVLENLGWPAAPYYDEPTVTVRYDRFGFRNEENLADWAIAVAGDSFTELGYLPHEQLFTTLLGRLLDTSVLNLGVSYTGPLNQLSLLGQYGMAPSTRQVVVVFAEANDLEDLDREQAALHRYETTGRRDFRNIEPQTSFVRALCDFLFGPRQPKPPSEPPVDARFKSGQGLLPVTLAYAPPGRAKLPPDALPALESFLADYAQLAKKHHVGAWLAYMPVKERVLHGQLEFLEAAPDAIRYWKPTDLPEVVAELCGQHGIRFIDLTPALVEETRTSQQLAYNALYDSHLNARGAMTVARELARHIGQVRAP